MIFSCLFIRNAFYRYDIFSSGAKNILLWKFLLAELSAPNTPWIKWVNKTEGTFRFMDTVEVSKRWGQKKQKADMNFEKLSRGIR